MKQSIILSITLLSGFSAQLTFGMFTTKNKQLLTLSKIGYPIKMLHSKKDETNLLDLHELLNKRDTQLYCLGELKPILDKRFFFLNSVQQYFWPLLKHNRSSESIEASLDDIKKRYYTLNQTTVDIDSIIRKKELSLPAYIDLNKLQKQNISFNNKFGSFENFIRNKINIHDLTICGALLGKQNKTSQKDIHSFLELRNHLKLENNQMIDTINKNLLQNVTKE